MPRTEHDVRAACHVMAQYERQHVRETGCNTFVIYLTVQFQFFMVICSSEILEKFHLTHWTFYKKKSSFCV